MKTFDMKRDDKVTIYISTCNRIDKLKRAVNSVIAQDYENIEVIICDDCSNDGTESYVREMQLREPRIVYFRNEINLGACATRNLAIKNATGKYITGLDDDDEFTSDRVSKFMEAWDNKYSFICANFIEKYSNGNDKIYYDESEYIGNYKNLLFANVASNQIYTLTENLQSIGGFDIRVKRYQDWDTWLRLSYKYGDFMRLPYATYIMHHDHSFGEVRVSKSYPSTKALIDMRDRNLNIYKGEYLEYMNLLISQMEGKTKLLPSIKWAFKNKSINPIIKFIFKKQFINAD